MGQNKVEGQEGGQRVAMSYLSWVINRDVHSLGEIWFSEMGNILR